jgi:hypothetical protein
MTDAEIRAEYILDQWLRENGYDGLCVTDDVTWTCACRVGDLIPCEGMGKYCVAGSMRTVDGKQVMVPGKPSPSSQTRTGPTLPRPDYLFGLHDPGGEYIMLQAGKPGWVLVTHEVRNGGGYDHRFLSDAGLGVIGRLNWGYAPHGTVGEVGSVEFAKACGMFVSRSPGCDLWIIGNEPNHAQERPYGKIVHPHDYAMKFLAARRHIRSIHGHENDECIIAAIAPWDATSPYPGNESGDWIVYFQHVLKYIGADNADGVAIHTYTHGSNPNLVFDDTTMSAPFQYRYYNFNAYRDFLKGMTPEWDETPLYITETNQGIPWSNDTDDYQWMLNAYREIKWWNDHAVGRKFRCMLLYRWPDYDQWGIRRKQTTIDAFRGIVSEGY